VIAFAALVVSRSNSDNAACTECGICNINHEMQAQTQERLAKTGLQRWKQRATDLETSQSDASKVTSADLYYTFCCLYTIS
jgi:hypothetical protein